MKQDRAGPLARANVDWNGPISNENFSVGTLTPDTRINDKSRPTEAESRLERREDIDKWR